MRKKMMYIMNVDWHWIKQRPHFFAELFSKKYDLTVFYQRSYNRKHLQNRKSVNFKLRPLYLVPRIDRIYQLKKINILLKSTFIKYRIKKEKPEYIFFTFPDQCDSIPENYSGIIIYDCMDNHSAFIDEKRKKSLLEKQELKLVSRANIIIVSSEKLKEVLGEKYGSQFLEKIEVIRNGYDGKAIEDNNGKTGNKEFTITYFGTISSWLNFEYLEKSLKEIEGLRYKLIGPVADVEIPLVNGIEYLGTIEHEQLYENVKNDDCLIMPFKINEIIESVDPVKLYEYINMNKNIVSVYYPEVTRFNPFVHFYSDYNSFVNVIRQLTIHNSKKYDEEQRIIFLSENRWIDRVNSIIKILSNYEKIFRGEQ